MTEPLTRCQKPFFLDSFEKTKTENTTSVFFNTNELTPLLLLPPTNKRKMSTSDNWDMMRSCTFETKEEKKEKERQEKEREKKWEEERWETAVNTVKKNLPRFLEGVKKSKVTRRKEKIWDEEEEKNFGIRMTNNVTIDPPIEKEKAEEIEKNLAKVEGSYFSLRRNRKGDGKCDGIKIDIEKCGWGKEEEIVKAFEVLFESLDKNTQILGTISIIENMEIEDYCRRIDLTEKVMKKEGKRIILRSVEIDSSK